MSTGTEIVVRHPQGQAAAIPAKLAYARELANSGLLPTAYRRNPANVLWAVEYGEMLGLPPMAAMTGVHVIDGKPTASAGLISGLVRQAGHQLRVWGDNKSATCEITRSDDAEHPFSVTWTLKREPGDNPSAEQAKLLGKDVWQKYPASMLKSRAITQCARDACEEVLYGLHYTPEELGAEVDEDGVVVGEAVDEPVQADGQGTADDPWYVRLSPEQEWLAKAIEDAPGHDTLDACKEAWQTSVKHVNDGKLTRAEVASLQDRLRARIEALRNVEQPPCETDMAEGKVIDLDPEWQDKVADIKIPADADPVIEEATKMLGDEVMSPEHFARISTAVEARLAELSAGTERAA